MIRLRTIGQISIQIGGKPVPATNGLIISSLLYLIVERDRMISRKTFSELFFPDTARQSGRQLIYRLRKERGVEVKGDHATIIFSEPVEWDVEQLLHRGTATVAELEGLQRGYLADFTHVHSEAFSRWLDEHRSSVTRKLRDLLVHQVQEARSKRDYRSAGVAASGCLGLDPLNEAATLAVAESLAATGAKTHALQILDKYLSEVGPRTELRLAPRLLRERIAEYVSEPDREQTALIGRSRELETLRNALDESSAGRPQICLISGQGGIGKSRLIDEACSIAALTGHAIALVRLTSSDVDRPFSILRDLGPTLLDLPGALGASPEALGVVRGLCGRGPTQYSRRPANASDARAIAADIQQKLVDLVSAVTDEQPLAIRLENADYVDEASLELLEEVVSVGRRLCVIAASRAPIKLSDSIVPGLALTAVQLSRLGSEDSDAVLRDLFAQASVEYNPVFADNAIRVSAGVPLFLRLLFKNYLITRDPTGLPATLADSLTARLAHLHEPAKGVLDAIVILGTLSTVKRIEQLTELPRYSLAQSLRALEEQGFIRFSEGAALPSHDLLADATRRQMPPSVSQLLNRATATILEDEKHPEVDPLEIALHWQASGENTRALQVMMDSARHFIGLGRPRQAISLLQRATGWTTTSSDRIALDASLLEACYAAGEDHLGFAAAERLDGLGTRSSVDVQLMGMELAVGAGKELSPFRHSLETIASNRSLAPSMRSRAARLLVMIGDDLADAALATDALGRIEDIKHRSVETIIPRLIFEAVFGSIETAVQLADELNKSSKESSALGARLQAMWTASLALWRCGELLRAEKIAIEAFELAQEHSMWSGCIGFAAMTADLAWARGDIPRCQEWFDRNTEMMKRTGGPDRGYQHLGVGISLALHRGDPKTARTLLEEASRLFPGAMHARLRVNFLAHSMTIQLALGESPSQEDLEDLLSGYHERCALGNHDFVADAVVGALRHFGRSEEANGLREDYLRRHRKERTPVSNVFANLAGPNLTDPDATCRSAAYRTGRQ
jgi:DNA-binding SARP family transcriptional activator